MRKNLKSLIAYDMRIGGLLRWKQGMVLLALFFLLGLSMFWTGGEEACTGYVDCLARIFTGTFEAEKMELKYSFFVPKEWLAALAPFFFCIAWYPTRDWEQRGMQVILRAGKRTDWWIGKCIWLCACAWVYEAIFYAAIYLASCVSGAGLGAGVAEFGVIGQMNGMLALFLMPFLYLLSAGMIQMALSVALSPVLGLLASILSLALPVAKNRAWIMGNYTMLMRYKCQNVPNGVEARNGIALAACLTIAGIGLGMACVRKKEFA